MINIFLICCITLTSILAVPMPKDEITLKKYELNDVINNSVFGYKTFIGKWISNSQFVLTKDNKLFVHDVIEKKEEELYSNEGFESNPDFKANSYYVSADMEEVLIQYEVKNIYRHSTESIYKVYNLNDKVLKSIGGGEKLQKCIWSPVSHDLAYIKNNDVYYRTLDVEIRLTNNGVPGVVFNGIPDWVYEEEVLHGDVALWFSPDGNKLAIIHIDDTKTKTMSFQLYGEPGNIKDQYPTSVKFAYPKAGQDLPVVKVLVKDLTDITSPWRELPPPTDKVGDDYIIGSVRWYDNEQLTPTWFNRRQNVASTQRCKFDETPVCTEILSLEVPEGWIDWWMIPVCSSVDEVCFYFKHDNGWFGISELDLKTGTNVPRITRPVTAIEIFGYNEVEKEVYYSSTVEGHPEFKHVYAENKCLTCGDTDPNNNECNYGNAVFNPDFSYYILICSGPEVPYTKVVDRNTGNKEILELNAELRTTLATYEPMNIHYLSIKVEGGFDATVKLYLPQEIDIDTTTKKYPMIVYVYGGPNHVRVLDTFGIGYQNYLVTKRKVIYCQIDGRGSGYKGTEMLFAINKKMGTIEAEDNVAVTKALLSQYKFIDPESVGIWGWSYGGYATALSLTLDEDNVFKGGISVAPLTSWIYYDAIYSERYMGKPTQEDNLAGYDAGDVTKRAAKFKNHEFYLIHGNADDNVHYQASSALARSLQKENIYFEYMSYPDEAHSLTGVLPHLYKTMDEFWSRCINIEDEE